MELKQQGHEDHLIALAAYEALAEAYAAHIDTKPHNAYYERPATLALLPDVAGLRVLDAGCGPGVYALWLLDRGAKVVAVDASPKMLALATQRLGDRAELHQADLSQPLAFLENDSCDLVLSSLVLEYIADWRTVAAEFHRVLRQCGTLVISVTHPFFDFTYFHSNAYHATELVSADWSGFTPVRVQMPAFRRSLEDTLNPFLEAGFRLERIVEPQPTEEFRAADPRHYAELMQQPCFLCIRASKIGAI
jgi:SAM-dependent methyltransferase